MGGWRRPAEGRPSKRIIKQSLRQRPRARAAEPDASESIVDPRHGAFRSFQRLQASLKDLPDFNNGGGKGNVSSNEKGLWTQSTNEELVEESGSWNCFAQEDERSIDMDAWAQNIVAAKTPVKECETPATQIPHLDLDS